ncbi:alpha-glucosidase [Treponema bryantii]|uniref:Alpha-glucosidase n=1 Tax=Treponema bryantii TaxID=163 RepID=A0A1H9FU45_9SPIR|nr:TIM-barrel domain-containing protein [Treponema bryantii]SEQ41405.1 alpha-glucosidase [Treponema bryantii]
MIKISCKEISNGVIELSAISTNENSKNIQNYIFGETKIVIKAQPETYDIYYKDKLIFKGENFYINNQRLCETRELKHLCYGLGEKISERLDRNNSLFEANNKEKSSYHNPMYSNFYTSFPCILLKCQNNDFWLGYYLNDSGKTNMDIGFTTINKISIAASGMQFSAVLFTGSTIQSVQQKMVAYMGLPFLPAMWMLGYHHSRYGYKNACEIENAVQNCRKLKIPVESIWYDIELFDEYKPFTLNPDAFKNLKLHTEYLEKEKVKKIFFINPTVSANSNYELYRKGIETNIFLLDENKKTYIGELWSGKVAFCDYTAQNIEQWITEALSFYQKIGFDGLCLDMNEPTDFSSKSKVIPDTITTSDKKRYAKAFHNIYANTQAAAFFKKLNSEDTQKLLLSRAGFAGIQKYAAIWTGDNYSTWNNLQNSIIQIINAGLSGAVFTGADIGGFWGNCDEELLVRWYQLGAFYPFFRAHSEKSTRENAPWVISDKNCKLCVNAIRQRYKFLLYLYKQFLKASQTGIPIFKPLFYDYAKDKNTYNITDEFLWGEDFLVAPILESSIKKRLVYFPEGNWIDITSDKVYIGKNYYLIDVVIDYIPVFVKENSIIQICDVGKNAADINTNLLQLLVFGFVPKKTIELIDPSCNTKRIKLHSSCKSLTLIFEHNSNVKQIFICIKNGKNKETYSIKRKKNEKEIVIPIEIKQM